MPPQSPIPTEALLLVIATLLPLASFVLLVFLGKRMGKPLAGWVATAAIGGSFVCAMVALLLWMRITGTPGEFKLAFSGGELRRPVNLTFDWLPIGGGKSLQLGIYIDSLTIAMFAMVTFVSTMVHVFSLGYMGDDKRYPRFFTYLGLFCFSMLGMVIGGTIMQLFVFWELVGLCSYLLIGFWYEKKSASNAAIKAFVVNRVGDFGFLIGLGILFYHLGNVTLPDVWQALGGAGLLSAGQAIELPGGMNMGYVAITLMGIGLFFGAIGKSAQFPLHVWLPDAMEGPTPVSALIHAATMVAAGVYLVGRIFPILTPDARLFIAIIGATTLTMAALIAIAQSDIKKVLAFSTLSQLGYMVLAMGVASWVGGLFHLITHAFFKALLFLGSGAVIYAAHHEQELPQYGGLWRKIPVTAVTFLVAVFAIAGFGYPGIGGFAGFYSKDMILLDAAVFGTTAAHGGHAWGYWLFFILPTIIAYVTAFYMMRCWMLTFWGKPRNLHVYEHAQERPVMYVPLLFLMGASIIGGKFLGVQELLTMAPQEATALVHDAGGKSFNGFAHLVSHEALEHGEHLLHTWVGFAWLVGMGLGFLMYMRGYAVANVLMKIAPLRWLHTWLYRRMYFDELYNSVIVGVTLMLSSMARWFDTYVIDGVVNLSAWATRQLSGLVGLHDKYVIDGAVNGVGDLAHDLGSAVRAPQTGRIRLYVTVLLAALALALSGAIVYAVAK